MLNKLKDSLSISKLLTKKVIENSLMSKENEKLETEKLEVMHQSNNQAKQFEEFIEKYNLLKQKLNVSESRNKFLECEIEQIKAVNSKIIEKNGKLENENSELVQNNKKLTASLDNTQKENQDLKNENETLNKANLSTSLSNSLLLKRVELIEDNYRSQEELKYKQSAEYKNYYNENLSSNVLDKLTNERNIYKEVINVLCDKHDIDHDEVLDIIDDIEESKKKLQFRKEQS